MRNSMHPSVCRVHAARVVLSVPSHVVACMNIILYAETATRAQKQMLANCSKLSVQHAQDSMQCLVVPVLPVEETVRLVFWGGSVVCLHHWSRTGNLLLGLCCIPDCFLCSGSSDLIRVSAAERNKKTMLLCINMLFGIFSNLC